MKLDKYTTREMTRLTSETVIKRSLTITYVDYILGPIVYTLSFTETILLFNVFLFDQN